MIRATVLACSLLAFTACGGGQGNNGDDDGNPTDAGNGSGSGHLDGGMLPSGVYAIPLTTPDDSFWAPKLTVGTQTFTMDLDTGSTTTGIAGSTCTNCNAAGGTLSPTYTPSSAAVDQMKTSTTAYVDNSGWSGEIYKDAISLEDGTPSASINIVDISNQIVADMDYFFDGQNDYQGILGMGTPANAEANTGAYFQAITQAGVTPVMAFELCPNDGTMWLGGYDTTHTSGQIGYTAQNASDQDYYAVDLTGLSMGSAAITDTTATDFTDWVVDTGTTFFYLPTKLETGVINALNANANFKTLFPSTTLKDDPNGTGIGCTKTSSVTEAQVESMLPAFTMTMKNSAGGADITVTASPLQSYLYDQGNGQFCLGIGDGGTGAQADFTMGDQIMQAFVTVIDVGNNKIGWATDSHCATEPRLIRDRTTFHPHLPKPHPRRPVH